MLSEQLFIKCINMIESGVITDSRFYVRNCCNQGFCFFLAYDWTHKCSGIHRRKILPASDKWLKMIVKPAIGQIQRGNRFNSTNPTFVVYNFIAN